MESIFDMLFLALPEDEVGLTLGLIVGFGLWRLFRGVCGIMQSVVFHDKLLSQVLGKGSQ